MGTMTPRIYISSLEYIARKALIFELVDKSGAQAKQCFRSRNYLPSKKCYVAMIGSGDVREVYRLPALRLPMNEGDGRPKIRVGATEGDATNVGAK